jgi:hypothetical protein
MEKPVKDLAHRCEIEKAEQRCHHLQLVTHILPTNASMAVTVSCEHLRSSSITASGWYQLQDYTWAY